MKLRHLLVIGAGVAALTCGAAWADYAIKDGNGLPGTIFAFVCQTTKICPAHVLVDSFGNELHPAVTTQLPPALTTAGNLKVALTENTLPGWTPKMLNALSNSAVTIKSAAGSLAYVHCYNPNGTVAYLQLFDTSGAVTLGTTTPVLSMAIPQTNSTGYTLALAGVAFANAIKAAATSTATGSTAPGTALDCNVAYN
jgi:hypothetical protein